MVAEIRGGVLLAEVRPVEPPRLRGRESRCVECLHNFIGELPLVIRKRRRCPPRPTSANVLVQPRLRACDLVRAPMQLPHLFEQRLERLFVHDARTLLRLAAHEVCQLAYEVGADSEVDEHHRSIMYSNARGRGVRMSGEVVSRPGRSVASSPSPLTCWGRGWVAGPAACLTRGSRSCSL